MGKKKSVVVAEATSAEPTTEATSVVEAAVVDVDPAPKKSKRRKADEPRVEVTLAQLAEGYLRNLEETGKSAGTIFSYRLELVVALQELGADTIAADLMPERVAAFFACDRVNKTRTGVLKARVSVLKTQRVLRQALAWAEGAGLVAGAQAQP